MHQQGFNRASQDRGCATMVGRNTLATAELPCGGHVTVLKPKCTTTHGV
jgi:hypothetical protein